MKPIGKCLLPKHSWKRASNPFLSEICQQSKGIFSLTYWCIFLVTKIMLTNNNSTIDTKCQQLFCFGHISHSFFLAITAISISSILSFLKYRLSHMYFIILIAYFYNTLIYGNNNVISVSLLVGLKSRRNEQHNCTSNTKERWHKLNFKFLYILYGVQY